MTLSLSCLVTFWEIAWVLLLVSKRAGLLVWAKIKQIIAIEKNGVYCGYGGTHTPEHRPLEIIYTLLFCRYAKTLPEPLGRLHLKRSRMGAFILRPLFVQHHLLDVWSACSSSLSASASHSSSSEEGVRNEHRRLTVVDHTMRISTTQKRARL